MGDRRRPQSGHRGRFGVLVWVSPVAALYGRGARGGVGARGGRVDLIDPSFIDPNIKDFIFTESNLHD